MKKDSIEYFKALSEYEPKNLEEELMVELLSTPEDSPDEVFARITYKICDSDVDIDLLPDIIQKIEKEIGVL